MKEVTMAYVAIAMAVTSIVLNILMIRKRW